VSTGLFGFPDHRFFGNGIVIFIDNGFFCPFFFDGFASPFCPACNLGVFSPFFFHRPFFSPFVNQRFVGGFFSPFFLGFDPFLLSDPGQMAQQTSAEQAEATESPANSPFQPEAGNVEQTPEAAPTPRASEPGPAPLTLLIFADGSTYKVTDYWLKGSLLHFLTPFGVESWIALERIDLYATVKANWERGVQFTLRPQRSH